MRGKWVVNVDSVMLNLFQHPNLKQECGGDIVGLTYSLLLLKIKK